MQARTSDAGRQHGRRGPVLEGERGLSRDLHEAAACFNRSQRSTHLNHFMIFRNSAKIRPHVIFLASGFLQTSIYMLDLMLEYCAFLKQNTLGIL